MVETKKISQLSALEQVTEQTCLLVEQEGKAYRLPMGVLSAYLGTPAEPQEFTFKVYGNADTDNVLNTYKALPGMTWGEWINSAYNTDGWYMQSPEEDRPELVFIPEKLLGFNVDVLYGQTVVDEGKPGEPDYLIDVIGSVSSTDVISPDLYYTYK